MAVVVAKATIEAHFAKAQTVTSLSWGTQMAETNYSFGIDYAAVLSASSITGYDIDNIYIIPGVVHNGPGTAITHDVRVPLADFLARFPMKPETAPRTAKDKSDSLTNDNIEEKFPWVAKYLNTTSVRQVRVKDDVRIQPDGGDMEDDGDGDNDDAIEQLFRELENQRASMAADPDIDCDDFKVAFVTGVHDLVHRGHDTSSHLASARGMDAKDFCKLHTVPMSGRYEVNVYPDGTSAVLARAWAHRMQFFFNAHKVVPVQKGAFSIGTVNSYVEPTEFTRFATGYGGAAPYSKRVLQIRKLFSY